MPSCSTKAEATTASELATKSTKYDSLDLTVQPNMNVTTNVLMQYTLTDLAQRSETNFWLGLICLGVCAMNIVLLYLNWSLNHSNPPPDVAERTFHLMEFWTSHIYAITEAFALVSSPKTMLHIYSKPNLLKLLLFFNVVNSLVPALLITLDLEYFECIAHELEFLNEFTMSFVTLILLVSLLKEPTEEENNDTENILGRRRSSPKRDVSSLLMGLLACGVAATNFTIYNLYQEETAHYLEFGFNLVTALVTFWFCMDNRFVAQMEIGQILYGRHQNCNLCQRRTSDFRLQSRSSIRWRHLFGDSSSRGGNRHDELVSLLEKTGGGGTIVGWFLRMTNMLHFH